MKRRVVLLLALILLAAAFASCLKPGACPDGQVAMWFWGKWYVCVRPERWQQDMSDIFYGRP